MAGVDACRDIVERVAHVKLVAFGDSIAHGLGARGRSYPVLVAERLNAELTDMTGTATQIGESRESAGRAAGADVVLIGHGTTEAIWRPTPRYLRFTPRRWRHPGWMDPRPYYSSRARKRALERAESELRWRVRVLLLRIERVRWCPPEEYERELRAFVGELLVGGAQRVVIVSPLAIDERFFPRSPESLAEYAEIGRRVAEETGVFFCDVATPSVRWDDYLADHFHPSPAGHERIAERILATLE